MSDLPVISSADVDELVQIVEPTRHASGLPFRVGSVDSLPAHPTLGRVELGIKRLLDVSLASVALLTFSPLLLLTALVIKVTSPGPVLFGQLRPGRNDIPFRIWKFRTMFSDRGDASGRQQTVKGDQRITPIGKFLRRTSIDELPQLINVLLGDMSIIGPRPHPFAMVAAGVPYEELVPYYHLRSTMRPGLSGWAQANGFRGPTDDADRARARIDHDIAYIQNFSPLLDLRIILLTVKNEFLGGTGF